MILAVDLIKEEGGKGTLALGVDNEAAIKATGAFNSKVGHYLMDILDLRRLIPAHGQRNLIVRLSGHQSIPRHEAADERAKLAAGVDNSEARVLPRSLKKRNGTIITLPTNKSALEQQFYHKIKKEAAAVMTHSPRYPLLRKIDSVDENVRKLVARFLSENDFRRFSQKLELGGKALKLFGRYFST